MVRVHVLSRHTTACCCFAGARAYTATLPTTFVPRCRNLDGFTCMRRFRFHQKFDVKQADAFLGDFFSSPAVQAAFQVMGSGKAWTSLRGRARAVAKRRVPATVLTMEFWDQCMEAGASLCGSIARCFAAPPLRWCLPPARLRAVAALTTPSPPSPLDPRAARADIVTPTGYIRKCMEDVFDGVTVGDELRRMFIDEDSDHVDLCVCHAVLCCTIMTSAAYAARMCAARGCGQLPSTDMGCVAVWCRTPATRTPRRRSLCTAS